MNVRDYTASGSPQATPILFAAPGKGSRKSSSQPSSGDAKGGNKQRGGINIGVLRIDNRLLPEGLKAVKETLGHYKVEDFGPKGGIAHHKECAAWDHVEGLLPEAMIQGLELGTLQIAMIPEIALPSGSNYEELGGFEADTGYTVFIPTEYRTGRSASHETQKEEAKKKWKNVVAECCAREEKIYAANAEVAERILTDNGIKFSTAQIVQVGGDDIFRMAAMDHAHVVIAQSHHHDRNFVPVPVRGKHVIIRNEAAYTPS